MGLFRILNAWSCTWYILYAIVRKTHCLVGQLIDGVVCSILPIRGALSCVRSRCSRVAA